MKEETAKRVNLILLALILLAGLLIRIEYVQKTEVIKPVRADAQEYLVYGVNIARHGVFSKERADAPRPDSFRSPGYPSLIAICLLAGGQHNFYSLLIFCQIGLGALTVLLTYLLGKRFLSKWTALAAALLVALSPHLIAITNLALSETFFGFMLMVALCSLVNGLQQSSKVWMAVSGGAWGMAYLINETALILPFLIVAGLWIHGRRKGAETLRNKMRMLLFVFTVVYCAFPVAWLARNATVVDNEALKGDQRALRTLSHGAYPGFVHKSAEFRYSPYQEDPQQPDFGSSWNAFRAILWERVKERPWRYVSWYLFEKPYYLWSWNNLQSRMGDEKRKGTGDVYVYPVKNSLYGASFIANLTRLGMKMAHPIFLILATAGILLLWRKLCKGQRLEFVLPLVLMLLYYTLLYAVFAPWPRYSVPFRPELYLLALWAVEVFRGSLGTEGSQPAGHSFDGGREP